MTERDGRPGQWYLHLFDVGQPDLDWMNDEVRAEFESILRFWFDRGVDGFRIDVAHGLAKDPEMPDLAGRFRPGPAPSGHPHWDQDEVHDVYRAWRKISDSYPGERIFVGEIWLHTPEQVARYVRPGELHTAFNFHFLLAPWDATAMRVAIDRSMGALVEVGAPPTWVLSNHDVTRHVTRYGGGERGQRRARAAALLMFALPGGAYVYQGEELGLEEVEDLPDELRQDPTFFRTWRSSARAGTAAGYRFPGAARSRRSTSDQDGRRGCRNRSSGRSARSPPRTATRIRCSSCTGAGVARCAAGYRHSATARWRGSTWRRASWRSGASLVSCASSTSPTSRSSSGRRNCEHAESCLSSGPPDAAVRRAAAPTAPSWLSGSLTPDVLG